MKKLLSMALGVILSLTIASTTYASSLSSTDKYWCRAHKNKDTDMYITFNSTCSNKTGPDDMDLNDDYTHWPNAIDSKETKSYSTKNSSGKTTVVCKGSYRMYSSLITQWASLEFTSQTSTLTHTYIFK